MMAKRKIFIVDDDKMMCEMIRQRFEDDRNNEIMIFHKGEDCLKNLHLEPNIVILDYILNSQNVDVQNGIHILKKIKSTSPNTQVIMLSSQEHYGKAAMTISKGAIEYLVKDDHAFERLDKIISDL